MTKALAYPKLSDEAIHKLCHLLRETDQVARHNVTHDNDRKSTLDESGNPIAGRFCRGGPFGALMAIVYNGDKVEVVGRPRGNNVIGSGIASRHAEDQSMQPDHYQLLATRLTDLKHRGISPMVVAVSSGQSCTTCHAKQEIMARQLVERGLLARNSFLVLYGATYDDTFKIAQFYDAQYADAMIYFSLKPEDRNNLIQHKRVGLDSVPEAVQQILKEAVAPTVVVMCKGQVYVKAYDARSDNDPFSTPEVNAIRGACLRNKEEGSPFPWTVAGELYTTTQEIGPLLFGEAGWTKINTINSVVMPKNLRDKQFEILETPDLNNTTFLKIVAQGYDCSGAAIRVVRDEQFVNTAQPKWAEMLAVNGEQLYNGAVVAPEVEAMRDEYTCYRFAAPDIRAAGRLIAQKPTPLDRLAR